MKHPARHQARRAVSMPLVLLFSALLLTLNLSDCIRVRQGLSSRNARERALQADYAARSGLQRAVAELSLDASWSPVLFTGTLQGQPRLSFQVEVMNNFSSTLPVTAPDGSELPGGRVWLRAQGLVDGEAMAGGQGIAKSVPVKPAVVFDFVIDERRSLYLGRTPAFSNTLVDSYVGGAPSAYSPYLVPGNPATYRRMARVHSSNILRVVDSGFVDAQPVASSESIAEIEEGHCSGTLLIDPTWPPYWKFRVPEELELLPLVTPPSTGAIPPGRYGPLSVPPSSSVTLGPGRYYFESVELQPGARLLLDSSVTATDPCELYLGKRMLLQPGSQGNPAHPPRDFQIYSTDEEEGYTDITCDDDSLLCATVAGLGAQVRFENRVDFYGAMHVYDFYEGFDSRLHYDESLAGQVLEGSTEWVLVDESSD